VSRTPRLYVADLPASGTVRLPEEEAHHVARVLRARPGDVVRVFDGRGREMRAVVASVSRDATTVELREAVDAPRPARRVVLCTAIPRGERMEWLVEKCVEAGVAEILPLAAQRSARKSAGDSNLRRWRRAAIEAAKQSGRADVPDVAEPLALEEALAATASAKRFVAAPDANGRLAELVTAVSAAAVFVGPEGGFDPMERALLAVADAAPFGLGPTILRTETAAVLAVHLAAT
jgi:16S rRNA (uracil1498-N3)-methyltransferase